MCQIIGLVMLGVGPATLLAAGVWWWAGISRLRSNMSADVLETIQPAIEAAITRQDQRIDKRQQRAPKTDPGPVETWERQVSGMQPGVPWEGG